MSKKTTKSEATDFEYAVKFIKREGYYVPVELVIDNDVIVHRQEFSDSTLSHAIAKAVQVLCAQIETVENQKQKKVK